MENESFEGFLTSYERPIGLKRKFEPHEQVDRSWTSRDHAWCVGTAAEWLGGRFQSPAVHIEGNGRDSHSVSRASLDQEANSGAKQ